MKIIELENKPNEPFILYAMCVVVTFILSITIYVQIFNSNFNLFLMFIFAILPICLVFLCFILLNYIKAQYYAKLHAQLNIQANEHLSQMGFNITNQLGVNDNLTQNMDNDKKALIYLDTTNKKLALIDYEKAYLVIIDFKEYVNFEVYENGAMTTSGNALTFNSRNFRFSGTHINSTSVETCRKLQLLVRIDNLEIPQVVYQIIVPTFIFKVKKSSKKYDQSMSTLNQVKSLLDVVTHKSSQQ